MRVRDMADRQPLFGGDGGLEQDAQGIVGMAGQADGIAPSIKMYPYCMF